MLLLGWGQEKKREEKPPKDPSKKIFKAQASEWKVHKEVLESFVNNWTNKFIIGPFCVAPLQLGLSF